MVDKSGPRKEGSFEARWRSRFQEFAGSHDDDAGIAGWSDSGLETRLRYFDRLWRESPVGGSGRWVDVGCGAGSYSRLLAAQGNSVLGVDYSDITIKKARERGSEGIEWLVGDATRLPLPRECFNGVLSLGVTQALSDSERLVRELADLVAPGGQVWVDGLNSWCLPHVWERLRRWLKGRPPHVRYESPWRLKALLKAQGLEGVRLVWMPMVPGRFPRIQRFLESPAMTALFRGVPLVGALFSHSMMVYGRRAPQEGA